MFLNTLYINQPLNRIINVSEFIKAKDVLFKIARILRKVS